MSATLTLNQLEVAAILPGLQKMVNGGTKERYIPEWATPEGLHFSKQIYVNRSFEQTMFDHLIACRNRLAQIIHLRKVRMNSFELAAAALALRVVQADGLAPEEILNSEVVGQLAKKLEAARKRAKRHFINELGDHVYKEEATRWRQFVEWLRFRVLQPRHRRGRGLKGIPMLKKDQRETMRQLAADVMVESTDPGQVRRLADLARFEVWKGRHPFRLGEFLSLPNQKARMFLAHFILKREGVAILRPEFLPQAIRGSMRNNNSDAGRHIERSSDGETSRLQTVSQAPQPAQAQHVLRPLPGASAAEPNSPQLIPAEQDLTDLVASWLINEVHPAYWDDVAREIKHQVWDYSDYYRVSVTSPLAAEVIEECKPAAERLKSLELIDFYAEWAAKWCLALNSSVYIVCLAIGAALLAAPKHWKCLDPLTRKRKISEIGRRYFS